MAWLEFWARGELSWKWPTSQHPEKSWNISVNLDVHVYTKTWNGPKNAQNLSKNARNNNLLKTKKYHIQKYKPSKDPGLNFGWPGMRFAFLPPVSYATAGNDYYRFAIGARFQVGTLHAEINEQLFQGLKWKDFWFRVFVKKCLSHKNSRLNWLRIANRKGKFSDA